MKHEPFQSSYRPDFEVVEQRHGNVRLYPHTEQLPLLLRALNLEFYGGLPGRLARADQRADDFHKIALQTASLLFCASINGTRQDELRLYSLPDHHLVCRPTIIQQITEETKLGPCHHFKFYAGDKFFQEIYLSGKRVVFADHVLQRFSSRVPEQIGDGLNSLLLAFWGTPKVAMRCGPGYAFVIPYEESLIAFPFNESDDEFFLTTCLTINEMNLLELQIPPYALNSHYDLPFKVPEVRNWFPVKWETDLYRTWKSKTPLPGTKKASIQRNEWARVGHWVKDNTMATGHGPASRIKFLDNIPGPSAVPILPNQVEPQHRELEDYKRIKPEVDWDAIFAERRAEKRIGG